MEQVYLFTPGDHKEKIQKALASSADVIVIDLEDGVAEQQKPLARNHVKELLGCGAVQRLPTKKTLLRINALTSPYFFDDISLLQEIQVDGVMIAKCEGPAEIEVIMERDDHLEIVPLIESALGVQQLHLLAAVSKQIRRIAFGSVDFALDLGVDWTMEGNERKFAMGQLVLMSRVLGWEPPIDAVFPLIDNQTAYMNDARQGKDMGFYGKLIIHPKHIDWVRQVYAVDEQQVVWSEKVVQLYESNRSLGAMELEGNLIDLPIYKKAKKLLASLHGHERR